MTTRPTGIVAAPVDPTNLIGGIQQQGTALFPAAVNVTIALPIPRADTSYKVFIAPQANKKFWVSNKTTTTFQLNADAISSDSIGWMVPF